MSTWCRHRTPFTSEFKTCKIGVDFHKFPRQHDLMPCLGQTAEAKALCPKYSGYTSVKATGQRQGRIPCPACKTGTVGYSQASNGHVHARCSTEGCASWME
jgi:hypothetical protein